MSRPKIDRSLIPEHDCFKERLFYDYSDEQWKCPRCLKVYLPAHLSPELAQGILPEIRRWQPWKVKVAKLKLDHWMLWQPWRLYPVYEGTER